MNIRQMRAFVTVAEQGSFTRAALLLHLSQPALTVQIRKFEETLGSRLLDRNSRGVALTRAGRELLPKLHRALQGIDAVVRDARALAGAGGGTVRIAVLPSFSASLLPLIIRRCRESDPGLQFVVRDAVASAVNALVASEEVDIGLTGGELDMPDLEVMQTARDRLHLVFPAAHPIASKSRITGRDVCQLPLVLTARGTSVREVVDAAFQRLGRAPQITCEPTYMMTAVAMVRAELGLTILPASAREISSEPELRSRAIDDAGFVRVISIVKKKGRTLPPASAAFLELLRQAVVARVRPAETADRPRRG